MILSKIKYRKGISGVCFLFLFFILQITSINAQSLKVLLKQGEEAMNDKDYFSAAQIYNRIILMDSANIDFQYKYATASRLNADVEIADHWYQKVFKKDNGKLYPETAFWLATIKKSEGKYKEAKKLFTKYAGKNKSSKDPAKKQMAAKAKNEAEACDLSLILIKNPLPTKVEHLDSMVN